MFHRPLALGLVAALLLAGCGVGKAPLAGARVAKQLAVRDAADDAWGTVERVTRETEDALMYKGRIAAVLQNPTDALMQRSLNVMYREATARVLANLDPAVDEQLGQGQTERTLAETPDVPNAQVQQYVQGIADRLTSGARRPGFKTHVILDDEVNAANLGGHGLVVNFALLQDARDEAELAAVLGHEITHGLQRHVLADVVEATLDGDFIKWVNEIQGLTPEDEAFCDGWTMLLTPEQKGDKDYVMAYLAGKIRPEVQHALVFRYNSYFAAQAFGRDLEDAADVGGLHLLASAKYDPRAIATLFDHWNTSKPGDTRYDDHPTSGNRAGTMREIIEQEKLTGTDRGADRLAAIKPLLAKLKKPNPPESLRGPRKIGLGSNPWLRPGSKP